MFSCEFWKISGTPFLQNTSGQLPLSEPSQTSKIEFSEKIVKWLKAVVPTNSKKLFWKFFQENMEGAAGGALWKKAIEDFAKSTGKHLDWSLFLNKFAGLMTTILLKKETSTQLFSGEFCDVFKNNFFLEQVRMAASESTNTGVSFW